MIRIGVDLGGTKTEAIALNREGRELARQRVPTVRGDYGATITTVTELVRSLESQLGEQGTVGVGIPGTLVAATGLVKNANSVWLNGQPLARDLSSALRREVRCANDANCFAVSEATDGAARDMDVVFGVILGTGCGGGLVWRGEMRAGPNGLAGEWGHLPLPWPTANELPGPSCYCGHTGCLETWISGTGFERDYARHTGESLSGREILWRARQSETAALACLALLEDRIARGLAIVVDLLDPDVIVLGGGLSNIEELYGSGLATLLSRYTFGGGTSTPVRRNLHGDSSGVRGAAWLWSDADIDSAQELVPV